MKDLVQVDKTHYNFNKYSNLERWASYYYQLKEALSDSPKNILEVGVGDKVFGSFIKNNTDIEYTSVDIAEDLSPDILGSVTNLPLGDNSFDTVCIFEVLEHLPFEDFEKAVSELLRVSNNKVLISLPHFGPPVKFLLKIPLLPEIKLTFKIPWKRKHTWNGEHYFEIGKAGFPLSLIKEKLSKKAKIVREYVPFENQYHHFFVLKK